MVTLLIRFVKSEREVSKLEKEYARLISYRADLLHHYYVSLGDKDTSGMEELKPRIVKVTKEIDYLRNEYAARSKVKSF